MNTTIDDLVRAKKVVGFMGMGIMPSEHHAAAAQRALREAAAGTYGDLPCATAIRVTGAIAMGVAPSQAQCRAADGEISGLVKAMRDGESNVYAARPRQRG